MKVDKKVGEIIFDSGFLSDKANSLILISDHGFCSFGDAKVQILPRETKVGTLKGDHHENAVVITVNLGYVIEKPQDVFNAIAQLV